MLILLTPKALESDRLRQDIEFALGSNTYEGRVFSVFVGAKKQSDTPWILQRLPHRQVKSAADFDDVVARIDDLLAARR